MTKEELIDIEIEFQETLRENYENDLITESEYNNSLESSSLKIKSLEDEIHEELQSEQNLVGLDLEVSLYPKRRRDGMFFSDSMNAKLVKLEAPDSVKDIIDSHFSQVQFFLEGGKWKSAQREINKIQPIPHPQDNTQFIVSPELITEIKANIDGYVSKSYS